MRRRLKVCFVLLGVCTYEKCLSTQFSSSFIVFDFCGLACLVFSGLVEICTIVACFSRTWAACRTPSRCFARAWTCGALTLALGRNIRRPRSPWRACARSCRQWAARRTLKRSLHLEGSQAGRFELFQIIFGYHIPIPFTGVPYVVPFNLQKLQ